MRRFAALYSELDGCAGTGERVEALVRYFSEAEAADAAWALQVLMGRQRRRLISGRRLREICQDALELPAWLFDDCHSQVGDSAETIALLWPGAVGPGDGQAPSAAEASAPADQPLHHWMEQLLPQAAALAGQEQARAVRQLWRDLEPTELLVVNKLAAGGLRVGVAEGLVLRALARLSGQGEALLRHRLMGGFQPSAEAYRQLLAADEAAAPVPSRPYPFHLASPLEPAAENASPLPGAAADWLVEWKWDGIRAQLIRRAGDTFLWSRGEELIQTSFPEVVEAAALLPEGTVLDGELLVWPRGASRPAPFAQLQRRLGRRAPGRGLLSGCPVVLLAYDLLEKDGIDWREQPLSQRRAALESLLHAVTAATANPRAGVLGLSPRLPFRSWDDLERLRQGAAATGAEGVMLKAFGSPYRAGRRRGAWWKHKRDPYRLDAVLLYAQAGSGRRANLFTDYTFALWDRSPHGGSGSGKGSGSGSEGGASGEAAQLVSFAKAYSGLDDGEILQLDRWIRSHTLERFGPVRAVQPLQVFELAFEGLQRSSRHKSGIAVRFPRISRWRHDKPANEADTLANALALLQEWEGEGSPAL